MNLSTTIIDRVDRLAEDEFQASVIHRSNSINLSVNQMTSIWAAAGIAWLVPGRLAMVSFLISIPLVLGNVVASSWWRKNIPHPRKPIWISGPESAVVIAGCIAWIAGLIYQTSAEADDATLFGVLTGAGAALLIFPVLYLVTIPALYRRRHRYDVEKLNRELGDD